MKLKRLNEDEYGSLFKEHLFEQYREYLKSIEHNSDRRHSSNTFFSSLCTAIIGGVFYVYHSDHTSSNALSIIVIACILGILLCLLWMAQIASYRRLNSCKFNVLNELENHLPVAPHAYEWQIIRKRKQASKHISFTRIEMVIPAIFIVAYLLTLHASLSNYAYHY